MAPKFPENAENNSRELNKIDSQLDDISEVLEEIKESPCASEGRGQLDEIQAVVETTRDAIDRIENTGPPSIPGTDRR